MARYFRRQENLKSSPPNSDSNIMKLTSNLRNTKAQTIRAERSKMMEKRVVNSLTELIDQKNEDDFKHSLVFKVLVKNIMKELVESGKCSDDKDCLATARKMAAFVTDIMMETYKAQKPSRRGDRRVSSMRNISKYRSREPLPRIPEEKMKKFVRQVDKKKETVVSRPYRTVTTPSRSRARTPPSPSTSRSGGSKGDSLPPKVDKQRISSWSDYIGDRTEKWTEWIRNTVEKAENSTKRANSGENLRSVSDDWKKFVEEKGNQLKQYKQSYSTNIWRDDNEAYRKRGRDSIEQWLIKNKLNTYSGGYYNFNPDQSNYSARSNSTDSLGSSLSSRAPSSVFSLGSDISRLRRKGLLK